MSQLHLHMLMTLLQLHSDLHSSHDIPIQLDLTCHMQENLMELDFGKFFSKKYYDGRELVWMCM